MSRATKNGRFTIRPITVREHGVEYETFQLYGWLNGQMVRRRFKSRDEAAGEKLRLEIEAANTGEVRARPTRLSAAQLAEAEVAFSRLGTRSLSLAVEWFLDTYRPPVTEMALTAAETAFVADRTAHVRAMTLRDYKLSLQGFREFLGARVLQVHLVTAALVLEFLSSRNVGKKRWNNLRGDLHAFFEFCRATPRQWTRENPVAGVPVFKIPRAIPEIETAARIAELFRFLESFTGCCGRPQPAGFLVPYFALATFAGLRPSVVEGEIAKLGRLKEPGRVINEKLGIIRIGPDIAKTNEVRQVTIQPNLAAWLVNYPLADYAISPPNLKRHVTHVREVCGLKDKDDVLRHTFISMYVAKFRSVGQAALEAGNSESMIKRHYLNMVDEGEAAAFWAIMPGGLTEDC